ncbi:thioesterase II family protein [Nonomuraea sp. NPDC050663]|uniref:thioesterase II family protein n=1 Tax=Nonomuraea sp. NPDC050663 TaxID=3364370 RepID=UPI00379DCF30
MNRVRTRGRGWTRALTSVECPADRLVCFPHSGGTAATYRAWAAAMPPGTQLMAVQYPGLADRLTEAPAISVAAMAAAVAEELARLEPVPCALFGHSLGALVAYETARILQDDGLPARWLFVSGAPAPWRPRGGLTHRAGDEELWSRLCDLGGIAPEVAGDREFRDLLLPVLRCYIGLNETYRPSPRREPLRCQVRGYHNTEDPLVDGAAFAAWAGVSSGGFSARSRPGGHFQVVADPSELIADILATLAAGAVQGTAGSTAGSTAGR